MGRHDDDDRGSESKEDRLLRKAREFVKRESRKGSESRSSKRSSRDDDDNDDRKKRSRGDDRRRRGRRDDDDDDNSSRDDDRRKRKHRHKDDRKKRSSRRDDDSEEDRRRHHHKKHKKKSSKKEAHREEKTKKPKKLKIDKSKLYQLGDVLGRQPDRLLDVELDYFAYHQHLWVYLYRDEGIAFGDLTSEDARDAFVRFCEKYNKGTLQSSYYESVLPLEAIEESKTTTHKWAFQTNATEKESLHLIGEGVRKQTEYESAKAGLPAAATNLKPAPRPAAVLPEKEGGSRNSKTPKERLDERVANRRLRDHVRAAEDEFTGGRKDGRERQMEKKQEKAAALHASARDREDMGVELGDADIYGGGSNDFAAAVARQRKFKSKRATEKETRIAELKKKDQDRQEAMLKALGLTGIKPGQKIKIAPRNDAS
mmetsp:Transcript_17180/g.28547  ORF Transcript_17180/g.28547 Transcript_17180/m.28547 type:complete len:427 (+) Transcript_17180:96-1376(+)|eukprot:CAMPEP_0119012264 /NCGR_PEP_ID=MMETSP1176-20130426/6182_1 /TAXON_ID=265551 /ORGANISM="Synedropsis recta cf, Strain CCMP1620" /LENGTH=426 /DNA_ID=CAMNT_0006965185 /DNA_START=77 /DNA_END=1357 /DNA_ORIENTATION=-